MFAVIALFIILISSPSWAGTYYVSTTGGGAGHTGAIGDPWILAYALTQVNAGDTVYVTAGTYIDPSPSGRQAFNLASGHDGSIGRPITFISSPALAATIQYYGDRSASAWGFLNKSYIVVDGFTIVGRFIFEGCSYCTIKNSELTVGGCPPADSLNWGIVLYDSNHCNIQNNYVHDIAATNSLDATNEGGIMLFMGSGTCSNNLIEYNTVKADTNLKNCFGMKGGTSNSNTYRFNFAYQSTAGDNTAGFMTKGASDEDIGPIATSNTYYQNVVIGPNAAFFQNNNSDQTIIYNNSAKGVNNFLSPNTVTNTNISSFNNVAVGTGTSWGFWSTNLQPLYSCYAYKDYDQWFNFATWDYTRSLSDFQAAYPTMDILNHSLDTDPVFLNAGGSYLLPSDLKIASPTSGRGGAYPSVKGAYIIGNETIGYTAGGTPSTSVLSGVVFKGAIIK